jgi:four helix bundle protein
MKENFLATKSLAFAIRIVNLYKHLSTKKNEYVISKQLLRSGTAIGALIAEGQFAQSKPDFVNKMHVALKEANETKYWLVLLNETKFISKKEYESITPNCEELIKLLIASIKTAKKGK